MMNADQWQRLEKLYRAALDRDPNERDAFLAQACQSDPDLLRQLESLLAQTTTLYPDSSVVDQTPNLHQPSQPQSTAPLEPGARLGPYHLEAAIGAGGMGQVFRAIDTRLHRTVAIKILTAATSDAEHHRRFLQEARAASALNHPNIVTVHDISHHQGTDFLVMEHVSGHTLKDLIGPAGLPLETLYDLGMQIASALSVAHAAGIVHRDIKPANIMVTSAQQVKILDFGLAKMTGPLHAGPSDDTNSLTLATVPGVVMGTLAYMSPEQTRGERVDARSDIFSLGSVLYESATGHRPFHGENILAIMHAIGNQTPADPSTLRPELPPAFDRLIAACLAKDPGQRPASAAELLQPLKSLASPPEPLPVLKTDGRSAVAVLPFQFRAAQPEDQFLSIALADAVVHRLSSSGTLLVRPMASVVKYAGKETEWAHAARDLNVDLVVEGTIQKMGPRVRVLIQVHRAADSVTLQSTKFDGSMDDLFALQDRIADGVSDAFVPSAEKVREPAVPPTKHPLAYELYLRAIDRMAHLDKFDHQIAIEILTRVIDLDPQFADAWGLLAQAYTQMGMHIDPDPQWFDRAERAIAKTLELDPVHSDALCARGQILFSPSRGFQMRAALRALNASLKINPTRAIPLAFRSALFFHLGFYPEADKDIGEVVLSNPGFGLRLVTEGLIAQYRGDYELAEELLQRAVSLNPSSVHARLFYSGPSIQRGRLDLASEKIRKAKEVFPDEPQLLAQEALILAREGNFSKAEERADQSVASTRSLTHTHHSWHDAAGAYALCGKPEKAVEQLHRCAEMGLPNYLLFGSDPHLRSLQGHPQFQTLMTGLRRDRDSYRQEFGLPE